MVPKLRDIVQSGGFPAAAVGFGILVIVVAFSFGRGCDSCSCAAPVLAPVGIDAGPGEVVINTRLAETERQARAEIDKINAAHDREIATFTTRQEAEYREIETQGPEALSHWFSNFNRSLRDGGKPR